MSVYDSMRELTRARAHARERETHKETLRGTQSARASGRERRVCVCLGGGAGVQMLREGPVVSF